MIVTYSRDSPFSLHKDTGTREAGWDGNFQELKGNVTEACYVRGTDAKHFIPLAELHFLPTPHFGPLCRSGVIPMAFEVPRRLALEEGNRG